MRPKEADRNIGIASVAAIPQTRHESRPPPPTTLRDPRPMIAPDVAAFDLRALPSSFYENPYPTYRRLRESARPGCRQGAVNSRVKAGDSDHPSQTHIESDSETAAGGSPKRACGPCWPRRRRLVRSLRAACLWRCSSADRSSTRQYAPTVAVGPARGSLWSRGSVMEADGRTMMAHPTRMGLLSPQSLRGDWDGAPSCSVA